MLYPLSYEGTPGDCRIGGGGVQRVGGQREEGGGAVRRPRLAIETDDTATEVESRGRLADRAGSHDRRGWQLAKKLRAGIVDEPVST